MIENPKSTQPEALVQERGMVVLPQGPSVRRKVDHVGLYGFGGARAGKGVTRRKDMSATGIKGVISEMTRHAESILAGKVISSRRRTCQVKPEKSKELGLLAQFSDACGRCDTGNLPIGKDCRKPLCWSEAHQTVGCQTPSGQLCSVCCALCSIS